MPGRKPNIVYLNSHDTGRYVSPYGHDVRTPHLQKLAEEGVTFRQAFNAAPTCSPSRAALCTGQYPHNCGMIGLGNRGIHCSDFSHHIAHTLKAAGYDTAAWGMRDNHMGVGNIGGDHATCGYDRFMKGWDAGDIAAYIEEPHERPFFLSASWIMTHRNKRGFNTKPQTDLDDPRFVAPPAPLGDTAKIRADWAHQLSDIAALDAEMGVAIGAIDEAGLEDDTLVIATTDHGVAFPGMKCNLTVHGMGVFLIVRGPAGFDGGKVMDGMVSHIDLFPTICDLIGIDRPAWLDGESVMPLVTGEAQQIHDAIYGEVTYHGAYEPMRCIRTPRYVYIKRFGERTRPVLPNCDACPAKDEWLDRGWADREPPREMLCDVFFDPQEMNNLAFDPAAKPVLDDLRARLEAWMKETHDPLLDGKPQMPPTGWEEPPDEVEPSEKRL